MTGEPVRRPQRGPVLREESKAPRRRGIPDGSQKQPHPPGVKARLAVSGHGSGMLREAGTVRQCAQKMPILGR